MDTTIKKLVLFSLVTGVLTFSALAFSISGQAVKDPAKEAVKEAKETPKDAMPVLPASMLAPLGDFKDIAANPPAGAKFSWQVPKQQGVSWRSSGATLFFLAKIPGIYQIGFSWVEGGDIQTLWCEVTVADPAPTIPVAPKPVAAMPIPLWIVVIDQPGANSAWMPTFTTSSLLNTRMGGIGHLWKFVDRNGRDEKGQPVPELAAFVAQSQIKALPYVYLVDVATKISKWEGPLPYGPKGPDDPQGPVNLLGIVVKAGG